MSFSDEYLDENYNLVKVLGNGGFGRAYLAQCKKTKENFVIKGVDLEDLEERPRMLMEQEGHILQKLSHPNIVKCIDSKIINNKVYIIMEYADDGDLKVKIKQHQKRNEPFKEENIINWFIEICDAINYVHKQKIIHRDLKPNNIFLMKNNHIKLGDFGIARILKPNEAQANTQIGTQLYLSPEIVKGEPHDYRTDIWDLGVILYEMICFKNPFESRNITVSYNNIVNGNIPEIKNKNISKELKDLIYKILKVNPLQRLEIEEIIKKCKDILEKIKIEKEKNGIKDNIKNKKYVNGDYEGEMEGDKRQGKGIFNYKNGDKYEGNWENDMKNGNGILIYKCGNKYEGEWKNDIKEGKNSKFYYNNGNIYEGEFKKNLRFGKGIYYFNNGDIYNGDFNDNEFEGKGILKKKNGDVYEGEWKNGEFNGKGIYKYNNGDKYEGEFKDGNKDGKGIFTNKNGEQIIGLWKNDEKQ